MRVGADTVLALLPLVGVLLWGGFAHADGGSSAERRAAPGRSMAGPTRSGLSASERHALVQGQTVSRATTFRQRGGSYVGGVSYQVVRASPPEVLSALLTVELLPRLLPRTKRARRVGRAHSGARVELVQGNSWIDATYTVVLSRDGDDAVRFRMDGSRPHDIRDVWGYFRAQPFGDSHTLVTVAVAVDVGDGLVRMLFEDRVQRLILSAPAQIRDFLEPRVMAAVRREEVVH
jgi:hypothetical protein